MGKPQDLLTLKNFSDCNAVAAATILHYDLAKISEIKELVVESKINEGV